VSESAAEWVTKARRDLASAKLLCRDGDFDSAVGRAYYTMFLSASMLLFSRGQAYSSHGAVHAAFGKEFAKTGDLPAHLHRALLEAFDDRLIGDYSYRLSVSQEEAERAIADAEEFLAAAMTYLKLE
jgi:uncharacterized protein (UPF0332 family)